MPKIKLTKSSSVKSEQRRIRFIRLLWVSQTAPIPPYWMDGWMDGCYQKLRSVSGGGGLGVEVVWGSNPGCMSVYARSVFVLAWFFRGGFVKSTRPLWRSSKRYLGQSCTEIQPNMTPGIPNPIPSLPLRLCVTFLFFLNCMAKSRKSDSHAETLWRRVLISKTFRLITPFFNNRPKNDQNSRKICLHKLTCTRFNIL